MIAIVVIHYDDVCDVANPQLVCCRGYVVLDEVGICRETMRRVRRARLLDAQTYLEIVLVDDAAEAVPADRIVKAEVTLVHVPQLHPSDAGIFLPDVADVLEGKLLSGGLSMCRILVILIVSLLAYTKQPAKALDVISSRVFCVQVLYCLAPAFFLIGILNLASATLIISS